MTIAKLESSSKIHYFPFSFLFSNVWVLLYVCQACFSASKLPSTGFFSKFHAVYSKGSDDFSVLEESGAAHPELRADFSHPAFRKVNLLGVARNA